MFCTQCGREMTEADRFCPQCGKPAGVPPGAQISGPPPSRRVLRRMRRGKKIAGVCAGFADYFEMDVTLMRIIFLATAILPPGVGAIAYVIAWIALPKDVS